MHYRISIMGIFIALSVVGLPFINWGMAVAMAQSSDAPFKGIVPEAKLTDTNNVDLLSAKANIAIPLASFGNDATKLSLSLNLSAPNRFDWDWTAVNSNSSAQIIIGAVLINSLNITWHNSALSSGGSPVRMSSLPNGGGYYDGHTRPTVNSDGSTIRESMGATYATEMTFPDASKNGAFDRLGVRGTNERAGAAIGGQYVSMIYGYYSDIEFPNGEAWEIYSNFNSTTNSYRPKFIVSNKGYGIQISYASSSNASPFWYVIASVKSYNKSSYYCDESALVDCGSISSLPSDAEFTYSDSDGSVTISNPKTVEAMKIIFFKDSSNNTTIRMNSVEKIGVSNSKVTYGFSPIGFQSELGNWQEAYLSSITTSDGVWSYTYDRANSGFLNDSSGTTRTAPDNSKISTTGAHMLGTGSITDELGRSSTSCSGNSSDDFMSLCYIFPNGKRNNYTRDERNNITHLEIIPATGASDPHLHYYATYPVECLNPKTCNQPSTVTDASNSVTTYTYDANHGGVLTEVGPADANGVHPSKKYYYAQRYALIKNSSGGYLQAASPVWLLTEERTCKMSALDTNAGTCGAGLSDLIRTTYEYGPTSGAANNLQLRGTVADAGGLALRTCYSYDEWGNRVSQTQPRAGLSNCP